MSLEMSYKVDKYSWGHIRVLRLHKNQQAESHSDDALVKLTFTVSQDQRDIYG